MQGRQGFSGFKIISPARTDFLLHACLRNGPSNLTSLLRLLLVAYSSLPNSVQQKQNVHLKISRVSSPNPKKNSTFYKVSRALPFPPPFRLLPSCNLRISLSLSPFHSTRPLSTHS